MSDMLTLEPGFHLCCHVVGVKEGKEELDPSTHGDHQRNNVDRPPLACGATDRDMTVGTNRPNVGLPESRSNNISKGNQKYT